MLKVFLRQFNRPIRTAGWCALLAVALTACGPQASAPLPPSSAVHGEPIRGESITPAAVTASQSVKASASTQTAPPAQAAVKPSPPPAQTARSPVTSMDGYAVVGFDRLASYNFEVDDAPFTNAAAPDKANDQIPAPVKGLDDKKVSIKGFMLPLKVADGVVTEFLIMKDQSTCCYGAVPKITEWVSVKTGSQGVKPIMDQPISILGTLHVGAMRENGYLVGIYQMNGDKLIAPED